MGLDYADNAGKSDQWSEYYYNRLIEQQPSLDNTPDAIYGDKELTWLRLVNSGAISPPVLRKELFKQPKDYKAKGDSVADDTAALQAFIDDGGWLIINGSYRITGQLNLSANKARLVTMGGAKLVADTVNQTMINVTGNDCFISAELNGNSKANYGIKVTGGGSVIENSNIYDVYSTTSTARAIDVATTLGTTIRLNRINNIISTGNVTQGDNNGAARAIAFNGTVVTTKRSTISHNIIDNIVGEEGDAIQVLFYDGVNPKYLSAKCKVFANEISNVSRRFIKIQASDVQVIENKLTHDGTVPTYPANSIDVINGDNVHVIGNQIDPNPLTICISITGASDAICNDIIVRENEIRQSDAKNALSIYCNFLNRSTVDFNDIRGGSTAVSMGNSTICSIVHNKHFGGISGSTSFNANGTCSGVAMMYNGNFLAARTTYATNTSVGGVTTGNYTLT